MSRTAFIGIIQGDATVGMRVLDVSAMSMHDARAQVCERVLSYGDTHVHAAVVYAVSDFMTIDVIGLFQEQALQEQRAREREHDAHERKEFERLRTKYGGQP